MKLRFVEEYDPVGNSTIWKIEYREGIWGWNYIGSSIQVNETKARAVWERVKSSKSIARVKRVLDEATI